MGNQLNTTAGIARSSAQNIGRETRFWLQMCLNHSKRENSLFTSYLFLTFVTFRNVVAICLRATVIGSVDVLHKIESFVVKIPWLFCKTQFYWYSTAKTKIALELEK